MSHECVLAIDLGATNTRAALIDETGKIVKKESARTPHRGSNATLIKSIVSLVNKLLSITELEKIPEVAICVPGFIDTNKGVLVEPPNLPYKNISIVKELSTLLKKRISLINDANAAAMSEKLWGKGSKFANFAYLTFSSGIGGGAFINNNLVTDDKGNGIEIGHIKLDSEYHLPCGCGNENHWESYCSGMNMPNFLAAWANKENLVLGFDGSTVFNIFEAIEKKNPTALNFFDQVMEKNLEGISYLIKNYNPELITIGGSVFLNHQDLFKRYFPSKPLIQAASFGDDASLVGTAASVFYYK